MQCEFEWDLGLTDGLHKIHDLQLQRTMYSMLVPQYFKYCLLDQFKILRTLENIKTRRIRLW